MTALLTVRADRKKLPIVFVIRCADGGTIESKEFDVYPQGHYYAMQENAWMNGVVWKKFLRDLLKPSVENPSVLLVDNFDLGRAILATNESDSKVRATPDGLSAKLQNIDAPFAPLLAMYDLSRLPKLFVCCPRMPPLVMLHAAKSNFPLIRFLQNQFSRQFLDKHRSLNVAAYANNLPLLQDLHRQGYNGSSVAMQCAAGHGNLEMVQFLRTFRSEE
ncbi:Aste57867_20165 [Aphanomyces stellatus]|uniref:Aste57867_20165 protein n=1 Tax=Aphanomyces stellatus TaxID=120398 RepID=A0A485LEC9_9STRA|nr:hypothetical protein As57867_020099 [Aphanomyces stellatus]VFT96860.1 Aste57867_20165 [Aphanomyces stellatus]